MAEDAFHQKLHYKQFVAAVVGGGAGAVGGAALAQWGPSEAGAVTGGIVGAAIEGTIGAYVGYQKGGVQGALIGGGAGIATGAVTGAAEGAALPTVTLATVGAVVLGAYAIDVETAAVYVQEGFSHGLGGMRGRFGRQAPGPFARIIHATVTLLNAPGR